MYVVGRADYFLYIVNVAAAAALHLEQTGGGQECAGCRSAVVGHSGISPFRAFDVSGDGEDIKGREVTE